MNVLSVAYPLAPVSPDTSGGAEQVLSHLDHALTCAGHRSLVIACEGSRVTGELFPTPLPPEPWGEQEKQAAWAAYRELIPRVLREREVDLIHFHGLDVMEYLPADGPPAAITLHLPASWYPPQTFAPARPNTWLHGVSWSQHRTFPECERMLAPICNGVRTDLLTPRRERSRYAMNLARICPEKGVHMAIDAAKRAGSPLLIAGDVFPYEAHQRYFHDEIEPRLDGCRRYLGPIGFERKRRLLSRSRCLVIASQAQETSSLVAIEALSCGAPVIAFPVGAIPEIVEHGRTGYLVESESEMAQAIRDAHQISGEACRHSAVTRYSIERTAEAYLTRYQDLISRAPASN